MGVEDDAADGADDREADLAKREADLAAHLAEREAARVTHLETAMRVLDAAQVRDLEADSRDQVAAARDHAADLKAFTSSGTNGYGADLPARRHAALDRRDAKGDRASAADDRAALTEDAEGAAGAVAPEQPEEKQPEEKHPEEKQAT